MAMRAMSVCYVCYIVQNGSVIWSSDVKSDIDSHLSSMMCSCPQQHSPSYVVVVVTLVNFKHENKYLFLTIYQFCGIDSCQNAISFRLGLLSSGFDSKHLVIKIKGQ